MNKKRPIKSLEEALQVVEKSIIQWSLEMPPALVVMLPTIRDGLIELIKRRQSE